MSDPGQRDLEGKTSPTGHNFQGNQSGQSKMISKLHSALCKSSEAYIHYLKILKN